MPPTSSATSARRVPGELGRPAWAPRRPATRRRRPDPRPAVPGDAQQMHDLARSSSARHGVSGPMVRSVAALTGMLERDELIAYVVDGGFVVYELSEQAVTVEDLVATTPEAAATLWGVVGSG